MGWSELAALECTGLLEGGMDLIEFARIKIDHVITTNQPRFDRLGEMAVDGRHFETAFFANGIRPLAVEKQGQRLIDSARQAIFEARFRTVAGNGFKQGRAVALDLGSTQTGDVGQTLRISLALW